MSNRLTRILVWPKRRWRSGGFGIHSPFAFDFITRVLYPSRRYRVLYAPADDLAARCRRYFDTYPLAHVDRIAVISSPDDSDPADAGVVIVEHIDRAEQRRLWDALCVYAVHGMDFTDGCTGVLCRLEHLPRLSFKVLIR